MLQDPLDGKGVLVIDAKGSDENAKTMRSIAHICKRPKDLRLFSLPAWNRPELFSHAYNCVYVRPRTPGDAGGDVAYARESRILNRSTTAQKILSFVGRSFPIRACRDGRAFQKRAC